MKTKTLPLALLLFLLAAQPVRASEMEARSHKPSGEEVALALGMKWWSVTPPEGAEGIEFGIVSDEGFKLIAREGFERGVAPTEVRVVFRDVGERFDLVALTGEGTLFMRGQEKPSAFCQVLNPPRRIEGEAGFHFVRFQSEDRKSWNRILVGRFFGAALGKDGKATP